MGEPLVDFSTEGVSSRSCLCHSTCEKPDCEHSCACWKNENFEAVISSGHDDLVVEEIGTALAEVMHAYDDDDDVPDLDEDSDDDDDPLLSLESDSTDGLVDVGTEGVMSPDFPSGDASESSISKTDDGKSSINGTPRLVSAMKGTRAKQGIMTKLCVSWAPDVYDPPVTSDSHTVRGHQSSSRSSRKGHYKYKPSKSSSSHSTNGSKKDKKHSRYSSSSSSSKKDRKHSYRSTSTGGGSSSRTDTNGSLYRKAYSGSGSGSGSRSETYVPESAKVSPFVPAESAALPEIVPVLKTMEKIKCATSCGKEKPFASLSRQFFPAKYKGMFSFCSQNQLAS